MVSIRDLRSRSRDLKEKTNHEKALQRGFFTAIIAGFGYSTYYEITHDIWLAHLDAVIVLSILVYFASIFYYKK